MDDNIKDDSIRMFPYLGNAKLRAGLIMRTAHAGASGEFA